MKKILLILLLASGICASAWTIDWGKIQYWVGEGDKRAALVVQFADGGDEYCYVWGYRWSAPDSITGEELFRAVASQSPDLDLFTQFTGEMGSTVCGIGYSNEHAVMGDIAFDFDAAKGDGNVSFNYFSANASMGQTEVPGFDTPDICARAIEEAVETHILEHPINAKAYGYPAYDYDHWQPAGQSDHENRWQAGWYKGYWGYFVGSVNSESLSYSGLGFSSRKLVDGDVDAWAYRLLGDDVDGYTGATTPSYPLNYHHFGEAPQDPDDPKDPSTGIDDAVIDSRSRIYSLSGVYVGNDKCVLPAGVYIVKKDNKTYKLCIN